MKTSSFVVRGKVALALLACSAGPVAWSQTTAPTTDPTVLRFRDFYQSPVGSAGLQMSASLRQAQGQRVQLTGYMVKQESPLSGHFFFTPLPLTMSSHADGEADDLPPATVLVHMPPADQALPVLSTAGLLQLTGQLQVGRHEMPDGRVVWIRLLLEPRPNVAATNSTVPSIAPAR